MDEPMTESVPDPVADPEAGSAGSPPARGLSWLRIVALVVACSFLTGAVVWSVTEQDDVAPDASSVDVGFLQDMITHHEQAQYLAWLELNAGDELIARQYAREVLLWQSYEIGLMDQMLQDWGHDRGDRSPNAMAWMGMGVPVEEMPGLIAEEDVARLRDAEGREADALFFELMTEHHQGAIAMAEFAASEADDPRVRQLADAIARNQAIEIEEYADAVERLGLGAGPDTTGTDAEDSSGSEDHGDTHDE